jgi:hypothetical protein
MRHLILLLALFPAASAAQVTSSQGGSREAQAEAAVRDAEAAMNEAAAAAQAQLDNDPCIRRGDNVISSIPYRECVDLLPPERMHGVWYVEMEGSGFLPGATTAPEQRFQATDTILPENQTWLDVDRTSAEAAWRQAGALPEGHGTLAMAIDFIGRRARVEGHYGHGGTARKLIVVDRIISLRPIRRVRTWVEFPMCVDRCGWRR